MRSSIVDLLSLVSLLLLALLPSDTAGFAVYDSTNLARTSRWSAEPYRGTGLHDRIQVAIAPAIFDAFQVPPDQIPAFQDAVRAAFTAWQSPVLGFELIFDGPVVRGPEPGEGLEIDVIALPGTDPAFAGTEFFGIATISTDPLDGRLLTSGQRSDGSVITGADILLNIDNILFFRDIIGLSFAQQQQAIQRLLMHEIGHTLGFAHPNVTPEDVNIDSDSDPLNAIPIDPCQFYAGLMISPAFDGGAIMSNAAVGLALFFTALGSDEIGGRDALYPDPGPGPACAPFGGPAPEGGVVLLDGSGAGPGRELANPQGIALDPNGNLYVVGAGSTNLFRVAPDGSVVEMADRNDFLLFGGSVTTPAAADDGTVYVLGNISSGARVTAQGDVSPIVDGVVMSLSDAHGAVVGSDGTLYAARRSGRELIRVEPEGSASVLFDASHGASSLQQVALAATNRAFVSGTGPDGAWRIDPDGTVTALIDVSGDSLGASLVTAAGIAVDSNENAYVCGSSSNNVFRIDRDGAIAEVLTNGPAQALAGPFRLATDGMDNLYALSGTSANVLRRSPSGQVDRIVDTRGGISGFNDLGSPTDMAVDPFGNVFVSTDSDFVVRINARCRAGVDTPPVLLGVSPTAAAAGQPLALAVQNAQPGARLFVGSTPVALDILSADASVAVVPALSPGSYPLRVVNPAVCGSTETVELAIRPPAPRVCGLSGLGAAAAALALAGCASRTRGGVL